MIVLKAAQEKILAALQSVGGIVERRHTLPILANVLIRKNGPELELITSDLEIQIRTTAQLDGDSGSYATTVGAKKLGDILKSLPSDQVVSLTANQNKLTLQGGKSRFVLQTLPAEDFPLVQEAADFGPAFSIPQKTLKLLISQVHFAMAVHDIRYYLNGILFVAEGKTLTLVATDGHRLALSQATLDVEMPKQEVILPRKTVLELRRPGVRDQAGRGQVPRLQPRHPQEPQAPHHAGPHHAAGFAAARCHPDLRKVQGRAHELRAGPAGHRLQQRRAGRGQGRARDRLRWRHLRDRLQRRLPDGRAGQHGPGHGDRVPAGRQQLGADHQPRVRRLQVRGDADADLSRLHTCTLNKASGWSGGLFLWRRP